MMTHTPVKISLGVDLFQRKDGFSDVEPRFILRKDVLSDQQSHDITPREVFHDQIQEVVVLETVVQCDDVWAVHH